MLLKDFRPGTGQEYAPLLTAMQDNSVACLASVAPSMTDPSSGMMTYLSVTVGLLIRRANG